MKPRPAVLLLLFVLSAALAAGPEPPSWLEPYPGAQLRCSSSPRGGACGFTTSDALGQVGDFYQKSLPRNGFKVTRKDVQTIATPMVQLNARGNGVRLDVIIMKNRAGQTTCQFTWLPAR